MVASSSHFTRNKLLTFSLLALLSLLCFLLFNRSPLDPKLRDLSLISQIPAVSRSPLSPDQFDGTKQPTSISSDFQEKADVNATAASKFLEPESPEDSNTEKTEPLSSKSDLDDENEVPISSNSNLDDNSPQNASEPLDPSEPDEEKIGLIAPESDSDDGNSTKLEESDEKIESLKETDGLIDNAAAEKLRNCDMYSGKWVKDEGYPLYRAGSCPYVDEAFDCQSNGRPDFGYTQWRWKPHGCELPRFISLLRD